MFKDPLMRWPGDTYPYDELAAVGITPSSQMQHIADALYALIGQGLLTSGRRAAWQELRVIESRLWVDFFFYPVTLEQILEVLERLTHEDASAPADAAASELLRLLSLAAAEIEARS